MASPEAGVEHPAAVRRLIGPHLPLGAGLRKAALRAQQIGATAVQIFTDNPTSWRRREQPPAELAEFRQLLAAAGIGPLAVHAPYLVNLCGASDDFWHRSVATMVNELRAGALYGADFVVMHVGSHRGLEREEGIRRLVRGLAAVLDQADQTATQSSPLPRLILENAAGTGDGIGASMEDLADILSAADAAGLAMDRLGLCLDTAHLWGAGHDIADASGIDRLIARIEELIGLRAVAMIHLNDSRTSRGSRLDRHEHIGAGQLGEIALGDLLNHPRLAALPTYLETPGMDNDYDRINLNRARLLADGQRLPPLPAEAFQSRRSSARTRPPKR